MHRNEMSEADVLVCGAGVIGCAIAREAASAGLRVTVLDRARPGEEASGAAAGMLTSQAKVEAPGLLPELGRRSAELFPVIARELAEETGVDIGLDRCGTIRLAGDDAEARRIGELVRWQRAAGWPAEEADPRRLVELSAGRLALPQWPGAFFPEEAVVDTKRFVRALWLSAGRRGARVRPGTAARALRIENGRCVGVETDRDTLSCGVVIDAAGAWAGFDRSLPFRIPVRPVRGQIVELLDDGPGFPRALHAGAFYIAPRRDGRLLLGSTSEEAGFEKAVTAGAVARLAGEAVARVPGLASARLSRVWSGLRPATPDGLPVLGETPLPGYLVAAGHFREGILLAPITARILARLARGERPEIDLAPFRVERFAERGDSPASDFAQSKPC
jgi:glycine oxidase